VVPGELPGTFSGTMKKKFAGVNAAMELIGEDQFSFIQLRARLVYHLAIKPYAAEVLINQLLEKQLIETVLQGKSPIYRKKILVHGN
jgi:hypothetical protein